MQGLTLPDDEGMVFDTAYVDDTMTYVKGDAHNLGRLQNAIDEFCRGSDAKINWNKSVGIWISNKPMLNWVPDPNFRWLRKGEATRYLGFKIGMDIDRAEHYNLLVDKIKAKLIWWNARKLSFAGKIVIANQVLMATMWHTAACWIIVPKSMKMIKRIIRNFLWGGTEEKHARAKVAWTTLIKRKSEGGVGLIDPVVQTKALLGKLVVRSLQPHEAPWKVLWRRRWKMWMPRQGGRWPCNPFWGFVPEMRPKYWGSMQSLCAIGIMKAWQEIRKGITCRWRKDAYARMYMPIVWNPLIRDVDGLMIGQKAGFKWAELINAQGNALVEWERFLSNDVGTQKARIWRISRGKGMLKRITDAISCYRNTLEEEEVTTSKTEWTGLIDAENCLIGIKGMKVDSNEVFYYKLEHGMIRDEQPTFQGERPIRLIAKHGKNMIIDPKPRDITPATVCWPIEGHLDQLS